MITEKLFLSCNDTENITYLYKTIDNSVNQKWIIEKNTCNTYSIKSYSTNKYLGSNDMNNVILFDAINKNTVWKIIKINNNIYNLILENV